MAERMVERMVPKVVASMVASRDGWKAERWAADSDLCSVEKKGKKKGEKRVEK